MDILIRPDPSVAWTPGGVICPNDDTPSFFVIRDVFVNGLRYRTELKCTVCGFQGTYDWMPCVWLAP